MKISLINPPQTQLKEPMAYVPLGLAYIGATLHNNYFNVIIENLANRDTNNPKVREADAYIITYPSASRKGVKSIINYIRNKYPESIIIIGGPHPSAKFNIDTFHDIKPDLMIAGEVEYFIPHILRKFSSNKMLNSHGLFNAGIITDLDELTFPARHLFDYSNVVNTTGIHGCEKGTLSTTIISSRGCPYQCKFCCKNHPMYNVYRYRSADNVKRELEHLKRDYGIEHIRFIDDCFTLNNKRLQYLCKYTKELEMTFMCITRADICNKETLKILKEGGCTTIDIGVESGSNRLLRSLNKSETTNTMKRFILNAKEIGLKVKVFLQYNLPNETKDDLNKTLKFLKETKPDYYTLSKFIPLPGSQLENESLDNSNEWFYDDNDEKRNYLITEIDNIIEK